MSQEKMRWDKLLCSERLGKESHKQEDPRNRSPFERDYDRIAFSESFRRLKDKTQVFPITDNDHVHNRLSHSLEVSCIGRSLGRLAGVFILERHKEVLDKIVNKEGLNEASFGAIVQAACLAHDIGNPPFGHSGEDAIQAWFYSKKGKKHLKRLSPQEQEDLKWFEGNAQGFRILTRSERQTGRENLQLTYATLATFTKYPRESLVPNNLIEENQLKEKIDSRTSAKKYGFFQSEKEIFKEVAEKVGLLSIDNKFNWWCRHPLAFLVEAADDICYLIMDCEDGFNMNCIDYKITENFLLGIAANKYKEELRSGSDRATMRENIRFLRGKAINTLMDIAIKSFKKHEDELLTGEFDKSLLDENEDEDNETKEIKQKIKELKKTIRDKVYNSQEVLSIEIAGYDVVSGLFDEFIPAIDKPEILSSSNKQNKKSEKLMKMLPNKTGTEDTSHSSNYLNILRVTDYISGMTDSYAVSLFKKIKGISLP